MKTYLFFDMVHLIKNVRNNLLNKKKFVFPKFSFDLFEDKLKLAMDMLTGVFYIRFVRKMRICRLT